MSFFDGRARRTAKVDLRGRSKVAESREQVLERTRIEREQRRQHRLEMQSATCIQVCQVSRVSIVHEVHV